MTNITIGQLQQCLLYKNMLDGLAAVGPVAVATVADAQNYIGSSLSSVVAQGPDYIASLSGSAVNALSLAQRTISTSIFANIGKVGIGATGLGSVFLLPLIGNGFNIAKRTVTAYRQDNANQSIMFDKAHKVDTQERETQLKDRAIALRAQAQIHMERAASTDGGVTGKLKYLLTFLAPVSVLPQVAALTTVPFVPAAVALGGGAVLVRYLANRFDAARERAAAQVADIQAREFEAGAEETGQLMVAKTEKAALEKAVAGLATQFEQKATTLPDCGNEVVAFQNENAELIRQEHTVITMPDAQPTFSPTIIHTHLPLSNAKVAKSKKLPGRMTRKLGKGIKKVFSAMSNKLVGRNYTSTVKALKNAKNASHVRAILARDTHSTEDLYALSLKLPDDVFIRMTGAFNGQLRTLEAKHHAEKMIDDCRDDKGVLDSNKLSRALAQHRELIAKASDNMFFTDEANHVKARLTMTGMAPCELLCRIRKCSAKEFRLPPDMIMESGALSVLKESQYLGGQELKAARRAAAKMVEEKLRENNSKLLEHLEFQFWASNNICGKMEQMLLNQLGEDDYSELCNQMAIHRTNSCMGDIMLKVNSFDELSQRLDNLVGQYTTSEVMSERLIDRLAGAGQLRSDANILGQLTVPAHVRDEAWKRPSSSVLPPLHAHVHDRAEDDLGAEMARQLADQLSDKIWAMAVSEGMTDAGKIDNAMRLVHDLRAMADDLDWDGEVDWGCDGETNPQAPATLEPTLELKNVVSAQAA